MRQWFNQKVRSIRNEHDEYIARHCKGKKQHKSEADAKAEASRLQIKFGENGWLFAEYYCEICDKYHTGRTNGKED